jgi:hypothetical protein
MIRTHQPGEADFKSILPEDIDWKPFAAFPPTVRLAVLVGEPSHWARAGEYVTQVTAIGPLGLEYMDARDDPRNKSS